MEHYVKLKRQYLIFVVIVLSIFFANSIVAQKVFKVSGSADFVSRYVWRGILENDAPNIQPSLTFDYSGLSFGFWGSYALSKINKSEDDFGTSQEIDTWISYSLSLENGMGLTALVTDYYYPQNGIKISNFNNYDNPAGVGAHTVELGLTFAGNKSFPLNISGYVNIYNDKGNNAYFQVDYFTKITDYNIDLFVGTASGSKDNPVYYGTDKFDIINLGITAQREIKITDSFSLPLFVSYIFNPKAEISYLVFGLSI